MSAKSRSILRQSRPNRRRGSTTIGGLVWGDEGKGKVTALLAPEYGMVVRLNGGANAGHTVIHCYHKYALHQVPSGIFDPDARCVIANGVVLDLPGLIAELNMLQSGGINTDNLKISDRACLVLPWHKIEDKMNEAITGEITGRKIGTTGRGIGPCYQDKALRATTLHVYDLFDRQKLRQKIDFCLKFKRRTTLTPANLKFLNRALCQEHESKEADLPTEKRTPYVPIIFPRTDQITRQFFSLGQKIKALVCNTAYLINTAIKDGEKILFEMANGALLHVDHGTGKYCTSSSTTPSGVPDGAGVPSDTVTDHIGILKAYHTRVGEGPFPTEQTNGIGHYIRERGHEYGTTTGRPRRVGWLDLFLTRYTTMLSGTTELAIMLLDVLTGLPEIEVCIGYHLHGVRIREVPSDADVLAEVTPIYRTFNGWNKDISSCRRWCDLPRNAKIYLRYIAYYLELPISIVSVGPAPEQTIFPRRLGA